MDKKTESPDPVLSLLLQKDRFSKWLGLQVDEYRAGYCKLHFVVTDAMLNGFETVHGGILFAAADSAFAFACNSHGRIAVALEANISFTRPINAGESLTVVAMEVFLGNKTGIYEVRTINVKNELVALFKGTAYYTSGKIGQETHTAER